MTPAHLTIAAVAALAAAGQLKKRRGSKSLTPDQKDALTRMVNSCDIDNIVQAVELSKMLGASLDIPVPYCDDNKYGDYEDMSISILTTLLRRDGLQVFTLDPAIINFPRRRYGLDVELDIQPRSITRDPLRDVSYGVQLADISPGYPTYFFFGHSMLHDDMFIGVPFVKVDRQKQDEIWDSWRGKIEELSPLYRVAEDKRQLLGKDPPSGATLQGLLEARQGIPGATTIRDVYWVTRSMSEFEFIYRPAEINARLLKKEKWKNLYTIQDFVNLSNLLASFKEWK